jgi:hypothetical protein
MFSTAFGEIYPPAEQHAALVREEDAALYAEALAKAEEEKNNKNKMSASEILEHRGFIAQPAQS